MTHADAALAVGFVGLTVAMFPADRSIARRLVNENSKANQFFNTSSTGFEVITVPGAYIVGPAIYAFGHFAHHPAIADLGWHGTEAVFLATGVTGVLKGVLGRARPYVTNDTNPREFKFGKGFVGEDHASFPSGHTTVAFAAASSVTSELQHVWPGHTWLAAPVLYGGATLVGLSRMYHNKHWASDVALGAAVGTFVGLKTVRYAHLHPDNRLDRWLLSTTIAPDRHGGAILAWSIAQ
ncbi:MAG: phosphatase PAP2 family protein [Gemmatimonadaceae bacterium]